MRLSHNITTPIMNMITITYLQKSFLWWRINFNHETENSSNFSKLLEIEFLIKANVALESVCSFLVMAKVDFYKICSFLAMAILIMAPLKMTESEKEEFLWGRWRRREKMVPQKLCKKKIRYYATPPFGQVAALEVTFPSYTSMTCFKTWEMNKWQRHLFVLTVPIQCKHSPHSWK